MVSIRENAERQDSKKMMKKKKSKLNIPLILQLNFWLEDTTI